MVAGNCGLRPAGLRNSSRLAAVTITIIMLVPKAGSRWELALDRVGEVLLGIVVALAVTTLVFPDRARLWLRDGLAQEFLLLGSLFEAILEGFRGAPSKNLAALREDALAMLRGNSQLLEAARNEPSGPGWREGLSMLSQFGRSLYDALVALGAGGEGQPRGPVCAAIGAGALASGRATFAAGFNYVAGCIHKWRFGRAAGGNQSGAGHCRP